MRNTSLIGWISAIKSTGWFTEVSPLSDPQRKSDCLLS
uniref:Uncharacterized protein n=1 Tax=Anguilla anguilla TaxID=7936 RepID=A0A0E9VJ91_ANGAN